MEPSSAYGRTTAQFLSVLQGRPHAAAILQGSDSHPDVTGTVRFYQTNQGVIVCAEVNGLPLDAAPCHDKIFGFHIHKGTNCGGNMDDPFADAMSHYDPQNCPHPDHAGDLPPLFGNNGYAYSAFLTNRFTVDEITGRTVIIHDHPDDFTTQPSGGSGTKIACGVIRPTARTCG